MPNGRQHGFTYMGLLLFIAFAGIALSVVGPVWHTEAQREKEKELLFVGDQIAKAIGSYYQSTPGGVKQYPVSLDDLLQDKRFPMTRRHLRKIYFDPVTGSHEWGVVKQQNRIVGIYSLSKAMPLKQEGFSEKQAGFDHAKSYQDWRFIFSGANGVVGGSADSVSDSTPTSTTAPRVTASATPETQASSSSSSVPETTAPPPETTAPRERPTYAGCAAGQSAENAQCRSNCGQLESTACRTCFMASFEHYRACLRGQ